MPTLVNTNTSTQDINTKITPFQSQTQGPAFHTDSQSPQILGGGGRNYVSFSFYKQETKIQMFSMAGLTSGQRQEQKPTSTSTLRCTKWDRVGVGLSGDSVDIRRPRREEREAVNALSSTQQ